MLVPSNSPLPTNSQTPLSASRIARGRAYLAKIDRAEKLARFGVLGFCAPPKSYSGLGLNIMADVFQTPQTPVPNATSSSLVSSSGSGVLDSSPNLAPSQPTVVPINGSGDGVANDPEYAPLTLQTRRDLSRVACPVEFPQYVVPATGGEAPAWGESFLRPAALSIAPAATGLVGWLKRNPALAAVGLFAAALAVSGRNR